jgi:serine/threonine protein kinase
VPPAPRQPGSGEPDLTPGPQASLPGMAAWNEEDDAGLVAGPSAVFSTNPPGRRAAELPSIGMLGRYALKYRIGEGGLGTVYAAHDPTLARLIAIKTVNVALSADEREQFNALFLHEARAAAGLSHPNIVTVFDAGIADGAAYIAMELLKGADLQQMTREGWRPTPAQAAQLACEVADALAYAHAHGVIHRDIKPANIFMVGRERARVLDFGIARMTQQHELPLEQEVSGGSPYYMAPEQILQQPVDARSDVYALGVVLYELLAGRRAFAGRTLAEIQRAVLEQPPPLASDVAPAVPPALARIAARAMAIDPDGRHPSAAALARELRPWRSARAEPPPTVGPLANLAPPTVRRPRIALAAAALLALLALGAALWWFWHDRGPTRGAGTAATTAAEARAPRQAAEDPRA